MIRALYVLYVWVIFYPVFTVLTVLTALTTITGCLLGGERIFSYYPGMIWSRLACILALCPVKVKGREHINRRQSAVYVANHQGAFDIFLIYGFLGAPIKWVLKLGLAKIPFVGTACRAAGFVFVDYKSSKTAVSSVAEAEKILKKGASVCIFPEGSRTATGKMGRFKKGAFQMALYQHLPVIPITLNGPFNVLPIGSACPKRKPMEIIIHPPIMTNDMDMELSHKGVQQLADLTYSVIESALWEKFRDVK